ncbi:NAD(P)/FAD-dependent oxidoreductase [Smaragdicoccus niigatensis]|uniref:NAD(P)/FAD-dependent oxidoreductase n=1 Tax=Smaragdicoccus niigatensis TaxID=359359 RepID=UPI000370C86A|nr:FAD-dependent oxidoreductase [Smaragdicoccus niigatensis]
MTRIAVIGSGVSGLTAAWALRSTADVTVFEADGRLGGHAHSHVIERPDGGTDVVDTGFIVMNETTYPTLVRLFNELGVRTQPTEMSMSVTCSGCGLEYAGARKIGGLFPSSRTRRNRRYLRMLPEIPRFHRAARALVAAPIAPTQTLREFLDEHRFSPYFVDHFAIPLVSCVWSCPESIALDYPAAYLFSFLDNHGMLRIWGSPQWQTVVGGSREYVNRIAGVLPDIRLNSPVATVIRKEDGVEIRTADLPPESFDAVVIATHPDQALSMLADPTELEHDVLGAFEYSPNSVRLHSDESVLPMIGKARASWNYWSSSCGAVNEPPVITYDMNRLQRIESPNRFLVSLNAADDAVDPTSVYDEMSYAHPQYTPGSVAAQRRLPELNTGRTVFAGAYHGWGFHEDGARSGLAAARALGARW